MASNYDLDERLIKFASNCMDVAEAFPTTFAGKHLAGQFIRCSTSAALNYGEVQSAESSADFIHKMKVCLKELRESKNCLRLLRTKKWYDDGKIVSLIKENDELIAIFVSSLKTVHKNKSRQMGAN